MQHQSSLLSIAIIENNMTEILWWQPVHYGEHIHQINYSRPSRALNVDTIPPGKIPLTDILDMVSVFETTSNPTGIPVII